MTETSPQSGSSLEGETNVFVSVKARSPENPEIRPFPGLRPFRQDETHLFFGRETHRRELLKRLATTRFVGVIGTSGSGKSSLIRAGLLPDLYAGYLPKAGSDWIVVDMAPGNDPIGRLAAEFSRVGWTVDAEDLRTNSTKILDLAEDQLAQGQHLLVLVDQFEEFFRLRAREHPIEDRDEKASFVRLLLNAGGQIEGVDLENSSRVHVVIAMRSEYLGRASAYAGFPEAIDQGQYLIPRLSREQLRKAIVHPIHVSDGAIEESLVQRLLNELGDDQDQLPILQHALMRTWDFWKAGGGNGPLNDDWYEKSGMFENALSDDASDVLEEAKRALGSDGERIIKRTFQSLRETDLNGGQSRRPTTVKELCEIAECDKATLAKALEPFRRHSFLRPSLEESGGGPLPDSTLVDVSHEALLRRWTTIRGWIEEDELDRRIYVRIATRAAEEAGSPKPDYFAPPMLPVLQKFWNDRQPSRTWGLRHHPGYEEARDFLEASSRHQKAMNEEARRAAIAATRAKRTRNRAWIGAAVGLLIIVLGGWVIITLRQQAATLQTQAALLETLLMSAKAASAGSDTQLQLAAEVLRRPSSLVDAQPLLLQALFGAAKPIGEIPFASTGASTEPLERFHLALSRTGEVAFISHGSELVAVNLTTKQDVFRVPLESSRIFLSADDKRLVAIRSGADTAIIDAATGQRLAAVKVPTRAYTVSREGDLVAFADENSVHLCRSLANCSDVKVYRVTDHKLEDIELSSDGKLLVVDGGVSSGQLTLVLYETDPWRLVVKKEQPEPEGEKKVMSLHDNVRWCTSNSLTVYDAFDGPLNKSSSWSFPSPAVDCTFSQYGAVTRHADGMLRVWNNAGVQIAIAGPVNDSYALALAGKHLAAAGRQLRLWEANGYGRRLADVPVQRGFYGGGAYALEAPPDSRLPSSYTRAILAATTPAQRRDAIVAAAAAQKATARAAAADVGQYDVMSGTRTTLRFDLDSASAVAISNSLRAAVFDPYGNEDPLLYGEISKTGAPVEKWPFPLATLQFARAWISPDERFVGIVARERPSPGQNPTAKTFVLDARNGRPLGTAIVGTGVEFVPNSDRLIVLNGGTLSLWESTGVQVRNEDLEKLKRPGAMQFSPDGNLLAIAEAADGEGSTSEVRQWGVTVMEWPSLKVRHQLPHSARVTSLAFRKDSKALLTAAASETATTVHAWDIQNGKEIARVPVPSSRRRRTLPVSVTFTPSGDIAFNDGAGVTVLANNPDVWIREACARIARNLNEREWEQIMGSNVRYVRTCPALP